MKKLHKWLLGTLAALGIAAATVAAAPIQLGGSIFPLTFITSPANNSVDEFNQLIALINQQVVGISTIYPGVGSEPANGFDPTPTPFSTNIQQNPLTQVSEQAISSALMNQASTAGAKYLSGLSSIAIYPLSLNLMASGGTAATATAIEVLCSPSGRIIASIPIANFISGVTINAFASSTTVNYTSTGLGAGCKLGDSVYVSNLGTAMTGLQQLMVNMIYTTSYTGF